MTTPVPETRHIVRDYHARTSAFGAPRIVHALKDAALKVEKGKTLAIVGESGSGKSTLARILTLIDAPTAGELLIDGERVDIRTHGVSKQLRQKGQMVSQTPSGSLNPRKKTGAVLPEPLVINTDMPASERRDRAADM